MADRDPDRPQAAGALTSSALGAGALLCEAPPPFALETQQRIISLARETSAWPGVCEVVPGMNNLLVLFDPVRLSPHGLEQQIARTWATPATASPIEGRLIEFGVAYGGAGGPDLAEVARYAGMRPADVARLHAAAEYTVMAIGALPGFGYMAGLDSRLAIPRRPSPRLEVVAGSVVIGGGQAGIISCTSPSGWHIVGQTRRVLFDPAAASPVLLAAGDRVRFNVESIDGD